jgi:cobalt-zinc-cadmium efflux system outer membrane protein
MEAEEALQLAGELRETRRFELADLLARAEARADLRALEARLAEAEAGVRLARAEAWPNVGVGVRYEREEGDDVVLGGLALELPIFDRGQGPRAEASARARRLRLELETARRAVRAEVRTAFAVHAERAQAAHELEAGALPLLDENESLARRSYDAGELALAELLVIRSETLETRRDHLARLLEAAVAAVELESSAGVLE